MQCYIAGEIAPTALHDGREAMQGWLKTTSFLDHGPTGVIYLWPHLHVSETSVRPRRPRLRAWLSELFCQQKQSTLQTCLQHRATPKTTSRTYFEVVS